MNKCSTYPLAKQLKGVSITYKFSFWYNFYIQCMFYHSNGCTATAKCVVNTYIVTRSKRYIFAVHVESFQLVFVASSDHNLPQKMLTFRTVFRLAITTIKVTGLPL